MILILSSCAQKNLGGQLENETPVVIKKVEQKETVKKEENQKERAYVDYGEKYWDVVRKVLSDDNAQEWVVRKKSENKKLPITDAESYIQNWAVLYYKNSVLTKSYLNKEVHSVGFLWGKIFYLIFTHNDKTKLVLWEEVYADYDKIKLINWALVLEKNNKYTIILPTGKKIKGYSMYYKTIYLRNKTEISIVAQWEISYWMAGYALENEWEHFILINGKEKKIWKLKWLGSVWEIMETADGQDQFIVTCGNKYGYFPLQEWKTDILIYNGVEYKNANTYEWLNKNNCMPIFSSKK